MTVDWQILSSLVLYLLFMVGIGFYFYGKNSTPTDYFLGNRKLGAWVTSMSAQASDMSGWLLMGLPGACLLYTSLPLAAAGEQLKIPTKG